MAQGLALERSLASWTIVAAALAGFSVLWGCTPPASRVPAASLVPVENPPLVCVDADVPSAELQSRNDYEQLTATVVDASGNRVHGLGKDDFKVYENGKERPVQFFRSDSNTPASVGILVDTSGSMDSKLPQTREALAQFIGRLNEHDDVFLVAFSDRSFVLQPDTTDHSLVALRLALFHAFGRTALYDAVLQGIEVSEKSGCYDKKLILLITDGMDTASTATLADVQARVRKQGALIYAIGIGDPDAGTSPPMSVGPFERVDVETLKGLSSETGGRTFLIAKEGDKEKLLQALNQISDELRDQYALGFLSGAPAAAGGKVAVEVVHHQGSTVRSRPSLPEIQPASSARLLTAAREKGLPAPTSVGGQQGQAPKIDFGGIYEGDVSGTSGGKHLAAHLTITVTQTGNEIAGTWTTTEGGAGKLTGKVTALTTASFHLEPTGSCKGSAEGIASFIGTGPTVHGSYAGSDCKGPLDAWFVATKRPQPQ
jgi:Ca-activated chloride channel family protein